MKNIHVCLVSAQTIPNILGIWYFKPEEVLFITTEEMKRKNKTEAIINTVNRLGLYPEFSEIVVREDSPYDCSRKTSQWIESQEEAEYTVNLTCGTKIMSISIYEVFKYYGSTMIYIPFPKNEFITIYPIKKQVKPEPLDLRLKVVEYLTAYSLKVNNEKKLETYKNEAIARASLTEWIATHYNRLENLLENLYEKLHIYRQKDQINFCYPLPENLLEKEFFEKLHFEIKGSEVCKTLTRREIAYLTGGWLEEYVFNCMNSFLNKGIDDVVLGIQIENTAGTKNEFDVMFTKDNSLYFIECKSLAPKEELTSDSLYKIGALQKEFGLNVKSWFITTSKNIVKDGQIKASIKARAEQFNTDIIPPEKIVNLKEIIRDRLKLEV